MFASSSPESLPELILNEVHVWLFSTHQAEWNRERLASVLTSEEIERAARFRVEKPRRQFLVARAALRLLLGTYLQCPPSEILFEKNAQDKPFLYRPRQDLFFNVSHAGERVLCAFCRSRDLGVDIEEMDRKVDLEAIAERFFTPEECRMICTANEPEKSRRFFQIWTRKEALIKAVGTGLSDELLSYPTPQTFGEEVTPVTVNLSSPPTDWTLINLFPCEGYAAALAVQGSPLSVNCFTGDKWLSANISGYGTTQHPSQIWEGMGEG